MALAAIHVKKPREAQIWNCCTGNPVLRILPDSNNFLSLEIQFLRQAPARRYGKPQSLHPIVQRPACFSNMAKRALE